MNNKDKLDELFKKLKELEELIRIEQWQRLKKDEAKQTLEDLETYWNTLKTYGQ